MTGKKRRHRICPDCTKGTYTEGDFCKAELTPKITTPDITVEEEPAEKQKEDKSMVNKRVKIWLEVVLFVAIFSLLGYLLIKQSETVVAINKILAAHTSSDVKITDTTDPTKDSSIAAVAKDGKYTLHNFDNTEIVVDLSKAIGFTPDKNLMISELKSQTLGSDSASLTRDFQKYLNQKRDGFGPLAGYTDGTNDYNQYFNHQSAPQVPAYSWMIHTGQFIEIPGVGRVEGELGRGALVLIINRTDRVYRFPTNSVTVIAGFQGWGRIWNGESKEVVETEKRLANHYLTRLGEGVPETGFIGQTDRGADNASTVTVVTVEMIQVGQFRLIRAETVPAVKK
jgi:hypothetical protein